MQFTARTRAALFLAATAGIAGFTVPTATSAVADVPDQICLYDPVTGDEHVKTPGEACAGHAAGNPGNWSCPIIPGYDLVSTDADEIYIDCDYNPS
ncbi:hypothetical protein AB0N05_15820 [Nocardia sp. NPDC051030]|uniref:hypothetical protein n=1 Tax=Nocardia sp. NPDC051030 TaxID=3155162 RepID=UPI003419DF17